MWNESMHTLLTWVSLGIPDRFKPIAWSSVNICNQLRITPAKICLHLQIHLLQRNKLLVLIQFRFTAFSNGVLQHHFLIATCSNVLLIHMVMSCSALQEIIPPLVCSFEIAFPIFGMSSHWVYIPLRRFLSEQHSRHVACKNTHQLHYA